MWRLGQCDICDKYIYPKCYDRDISAIDSFSCSICINIKVRLPFNYPFGHLIVQSIHLYVHLSAWLVSMKFCLKGNFFSISHLPVQIKVYKENIRTNRETSQQANSELCQTSKMKLFAKILNSFQLLLSFLPKLFYIDACSEPSQTSKKKLFAKIVNSFQP